MEKQEYKELLYVLDDFYEKEHIIIYWSNGLKVKCKSFTGMYETDTEPEDEDYIGEYAAAVSDVEIIEPAKDESVQIFNNSIEVSLKSIPDKISLEDGTILWKR